MMNKKFRPTVPQSLIYVEPRIPTLRAGQRKLTISARDREDAAMAGQRVAGYAWAPLIASGPYRTGVSTWTFILNDDTGTPQAQKMADLRKQRVAEKKCWECPAPAKPGHRRCEPCLERKRLRQKLGPAL